MRLEWYLWAGCEGEGTLGLRPWGRGVGIGGHSCSKIQQSVFVDSFADLWELSIKRDKNNKADNFPWVWN